MGVREFTRILLVFVTAVTAAWGATATFSPSEAVVAAGDPAVFEVSVAVDHVTLNEFQGVDLVIGWDQPGAITFSYSAEFRSAMTAFVADPPTYDEGYYTHDVYLGGASPTAVGESIRLGTLTVETGGLPAGEYAVQVYVDVEAGLSALSLGGQLEAVLGGATVRVSGAAPNGNDNGVPDDQDHGGGTAPDGGTNGLPDDGSTNGTPDNTNDNGHSSTNDNTPDGDVSNDNEGANDNSSDNGSVNDNTAGGGAANHNGNANESHPRRGTASRSPCGIGLLGALPAGMAGLVLLHAQRRRRSYG